jgi:hypothetical protein
VPFSFSASSWLFPSTAARAWSGIALSRAVMTLSRCLWQAWANAGVISERTGTLIGDRAVDRQDVIIGTGLLPVASSAMLPAQRRHGLPLSFSYAGGHTMARLVTAALLLVATSLPALACSYHSTAADRNSTVASQPSDTRTVTPQKAS